jgi:hypothetical protein
VREFETPLDSYTANYAPEQAETGFMGQLKETAAIPNPHDVMPFVSQANSEPVDTKPAKTSKKKNKKRKSNVSQEGSLGESTSPSSSKGAEKKDASSQLKEKTDSYNEINTGLAVGENGAGGDGSGTEMDGGTNLGENETNARRRMTWADLFNADNAKRQGKGKTSIWDNEV